MTVIIDGYEMDGISYWVTRNYFTFKSPFRDEHCAPAWSLSRLLSLMPKTIEADGRVFALNMAFSRARIIISFADRDGRTLTIEQSAEPVGACVKMIETLTRNGFLMN